MKTHNYFITGLPRSGTAWLANFLTWGNSFCNHEGIHGHTDFEAYANSLNQAEYTGDCDTGLALLLPWLFKRFPNARYMFIVRDLKSVRASLSEAGFRHTDLSELHRSLQWGMKNIPCMVIDFERLFIDTKLIWEYIGLTDFPTQRHAMLQNMNINDSSRFLNTEPLNLKALMREAA